MVLLPGPGAGVESLLILDPTCQQDTSRRRMTQFLRTPTLTAGRLSSSLAQSRRQGHSGASRRQMPERENVNVLKDVEGKVSMLTHKRLPMLQAPEVSYVNSESSSVECSTRQ